MPPSSKTPTTDIRTDILLLILIAIIAVALYLHKNPLIITSTDPITSGSLPPESPVQSDVLLILPDRSKDDPEAPSFQTLDPSLNWYNTLSQEQGPINTTLLSKLSPASLERKRLVVLPSRVTQRIQPAAISVLDAWVSRGGVLLLEQPPSSFSALTRFATQDGDPIPAHKITSADGAPLRGALRDSMLDAPLLTTVRPPTASKQALASSNIDILMEVDGRPALLYTPRAEGHVYTLTIDLARAVLALQQGLPNSPNSWDTSHTPEDDPSLPGQIPDGLALPSGRVADRKMLNIVTPYADLLERNVLASTLLHTPIPRVWYFPDTHAGAYITTHDEQHIGPKTTFVTQWEHQHKRRSTLFTAATSLPKDTVTNLLKQHHDPQLLWGRGWDGNLDVVSGGIAFWQPVRHELSLSTQSLLLNTLLSTPNAAPLVRIEQSLLDPDWSTTFQKLAAAGAYADSSLGPTHPEHVGYLFGTGLPFYPLDKRGLLLPLFEVPYVLRDDQQRASHHHWRLIRSSESGFHQLITTNFRAGTMAQTPSVDGYNTWKNATEQAARKKHWVTTLHDFLLFEETRRSIQLSSTFYPAQRLLTIQVNIPAPITQPEEPTAHPAQGKKTRPKRNAKKPPRPEGIPSVAFPQNHRGISIEHVRLNGSSYPERRLGRSNDSLFHILRLDPGQHIIEVVYGE